MYWLYENEDMIIIFKFFNKIKVFFEYYNLGMVKIDFCLVSLDYLFMDEIDDVNY